VIHPASDDSAATLSASDLQSCFASKLGGLISPLLLAWHRLRYEAFSDDIAR
jgi:hypothetical protein